MKKKYFFLAAFFIVLAFCSVCVACTPRAETENVVAYIVRFDDNWDGNSIKTEVEEGKLVALPEDPVRLGYVFKGWFTSCEDDASQQFDATEPIERDVTVYAKWERDENVSLITLKYLNYRTADAFCAVDKGAVFAKPENPKYDENEMYAFKGWYTDSACTAEYDFTLSVNEDIILYAGWTQQKTTVTFDSNYAGSEKPVTVIVELGGIVERPASPARDQYEFIDWYTERVGGTAFSFESPVDEKANVYAHWSRSEYNVSFNLNGAQLDRSGLTDGTYRNGAVLYSVKRGESVEELAGNILSAMSYEGYEFAGWYTECILPGTDIEENDPAPADLSAVNDDMIVYARWTLKEYEVAFDYHYEGAPQAPESQTVKHGQYLQDPGSPEREGWLFTGWFTDIDFTEQFTFDMPVIKDMTLHARWFEDSSLPQEVTVSYYYNVGGADVLHSTSTIDFNGMAESDRPADPAVTDYYFAGWYEDAAFTKAFNMNANLTENVSVYAKMLKKYTFEAEATDLTGKSGQGTSTNSFEAEMIMDYTYVKGGSTDTVSNGYFVRELYYNGASLDFIIEAEEEVFDAVMYLRVSSESYEFFTTKEKDGVVYNYLSDTEFKIIVNGEWNGDEPVTWLNYGGLYMPMANVDEREDLASNKTPFEDCLIAVNLHLVKGTNYISLYVANNNNHGGTFHAEAPIIDCMYIYSSTELTMVDYKFYEEDGVKRG